MITNTNKSGVKTRKKIPVGVIIIASLVIIIGLVMLRVNSYMKKKKDGVEMAATEPEIGAEERRKGMEGSGQEFMGFFKGTVVEKDSIKDKPKIDPKDVAAGVNVKPKKTEIKEPVKTEVAKTALTETIQKASEPKPVKRVEPKPKAEEKKPEVKFNFVIVKEEEPAVKSIIKENVQLDGSLSHAKIYGTQKVRDQETVTIRNMEDIELSKRLIIPSQSILYGLCSVSGNRMKIHITKALTMHGNIEVNMSVFDNDFQEGLFIKNAIQMGVEENSNTLIEEIAQNSANPITGTVMKQTAKSVQRNAKRLQKIELPLEDGYDIYLNVIKNKRN